MFDERTTELVEFGGSLCASIEQVSDEAEAHEEPEVRVRARKKRAEPSRGRVFKYRLYPTRAQKGKLDELTWRLREFYNAVLEHRREAYRKQRVSIKASDQAKEIPAIREVRPEYAEIHSHLLQDVVTRVDRAFQAFFRRVAAGEKPGYPRFKGRNRYRSFTFKDVGAGRGARLTTGGKRVEIAGIGSVKIKMHRPMEGTLKQATVSLGGDGHWYICFVCVDIPAKPLPLTGREVGVDLGITTFAALSNEDGTDKDIPNPRPYERAQDKLASAQRKVSRRRKYSKRRAKAVALLAKKHAKVARVRLDFHHKTARYLVVCYESIYLEDLNITGLAKGWLSKQVYDAGWGQFGTILSNKAECAGRWFSRSDPRGTSIICSNPLCEKRVPKALNVRVHDCPYCGLKINRDTNAAPNTKSRGQRDREKQSLDAL